VDNQNSSFSVSRENKAGKAVLRIALAGKREDWEPQLRAMVDTEFEDVGLKDKISQAAQDLPDILEKPVTLEISIDKPIIPEDAITSISQIPQALEETDLPAIYLTKTIGGKHRDVLLLGETHVANEDESKAASKIIPFFGCLGVEGVDVSQCLEGRIFFWVFYKVFFPILSFFSFGKKRSEEHKSSIDQANHSTARVVWLEEGWQPTIRMRLFFVAFTAFIIYWLISVGRGSVEAANEDGAGDVILYLALITVGLLIGRTKIFSKLCGFFFGFVGGYIFGLTGSRDKNMTKNLVKALNEEASVDNALVLTGKAHTPRIAKILQKKHGFERRDFPTS